MRRGGVPVIVSAVCIFTVPTLSCAVLATGDGALVSQLPVLVHLRAQRVLHVYSGHGNVDNGHIIGMRKKRFKTLVLHTSAIMNICLYTKPHTGMHKESI